jgi:hypothetical protein
VWGVAALIAYAVLAGISGKLSPLARAPLLDGLGPIAPYRWVEPPLELEATNQPPSAGRFRVDMTPKGSKGTVLFTSDNQVTLLLETGAIPPAPGEDAVEVAIEPTNPTTLPPPPEGLVFFGNAYDLPFELRPGREPIEDFDQGVTVTLLYPVTATLHGADHEVLWSSDGGEWISIGGTDNPGLQQIEADLPAPGAVIVAGRPAPRTAAPVSEGGLSTLSMALIVVAGVALVAGVVYLIRGLRS